MKTATVVLKSIKDPDEWGQLIEELGLSDRAVKNHFDWHEYANLELTFDENLNVVKGRILPK